MSCLGEPTIQKISRSGCLLMYWNLSDLYIFDFEISNDGVVEEITRVTPTITSLDKTFPEW